MSHYIRIPFQDLTRAYENGSVEKRYFLDVETGEILPIFVDMIERGANTADAQRIAGGVGTRYFLLPHKPKGEGYGEMEDFIETVSDLQARDSLYKAIEGKGAFRRFREILAIYPPDEERWLELKFTKTDKVIDDWLEKNEIVLEETS